MTSRRGRHPTNGVVEAGESCDDGNTSAGDGCDPECSRELGETCDENAQCASEFCDLDGDICACDEASDCPSDQECNTTLVPNACMPVYCGNGTLDSGEGCDDSNRQDGDGCSAQCLVELGGDCTGDAECASGSCDESEEICICTEDSHCGDDEICADMQTTSECVPVGCGNAVREAGEACDDGNVTNGDGCDSECDVEPGFECTGMPSECSPTGCVSDDDCGAREFCDLASRECEGVECRMDAHCNDNEVCDRVSHTCGECFKDADCPASFACDTARNECGPTVEVYASGNGIFCALRHDGPSRSQGVVLVLLGLLAFGRRRKRPGHADKRAIVHWTRFTETARETMMRSMLPAVLALVLAAVTFACNSDDSGGSNDGGGAGSLCERGCEETMSADCDNGPETYAECVNDCEGLEIGDCDAPYSVLQACAEGEAVTCDALGFPVVEACSDEQNAFIACLLGG
jgi:cysteine-rich repeat protein